jgi:hypothetical protein
VAPSDSSTSRFGAGPSGFGGGRWPRRWLISSTDELGRVVCRAERTTGREARAWGSDF